MSGSSSEPWRMIRPSCAQDNGRLLGDVMLRFRPIAPKPATCPVGPPENISAFSSEKRRKRKYVRVRRNSRYTRRRTDKKPEKNDVVSDDDAAEKEERGSSAASLLQLLPERSSDLDRPIESDDHRTTDQSTAVVVVAVVVVQARSTAEDGHLSVRSWEMSLESDTCPGFVSDGSDSVTWVNRAFRKMVTESNGDGGGDEKVVVGLVIKEGFPSFYSALTGHVKLQYYNSHARDGKLHSRVVPFDLWRMDGGGFAWRLDVDAALTLGRT